VTRTKRGRLIGAIGAVAVIGAIGIAAGCGDDDEAEASRADVVEHYADGVHASYAASLASAEEMDAAIDAFVADPTEETLEAAREAWLVARADYGPTEAFRFYGGPIDDEETGEEGQINAWPLDEAYIDYVEGDPDAGIINDPGTVPEITEDAIIELNEKGGETNVSTGWHAIEFLLWGQDLSEDGPGVRPATDYTTADNAERRKAYLTVASGLLVSDLGELVAAWDPATDGNYRAEFLALPEDEALQMAFVGIGELSRGELAGERMNVAYSERSQEDEHSCFSDNTTADLIGNAEGIQMVYSGAYPGLDGPGLSVLVAAEDPDLDEELTASLSESVALVAEIPAPFDQHLQEGVPDDDPGRVAVLAGIEALEDQTDLIVDAADSLGISVNVS
jgi:putative iron-regulated protein